MLTDEELLRIIGLFVRDGITQVRLTGGEPLLRRSLVDLVAGIAALEPRPKIAMTTNGVGLERVAIGLKDGRPRPGQRQPRHDRLRDLHPADPPRPARRRRGGPQGRVRRRAHAGQGQRRRDARHQRRVGRRRPRLVPRARLRAPVHRADAARRPARLGPRPDDLRRRDPRAAVAALGAHAAAGGRAGECPGRAVPRRRRSRDRRHHRQCQRPVLLRLRPHPADRRRAGAQLPLLDHRDRPARAAARGRDRRRAARL